MAWEDLSSVLHRAAQVGIGEDIEFLPDDSLASVYPSTTIRGNFNEFHTDVVIEDGVAVEMQRPVLSILLADLPYDPKEGYIAVVRGTNYVVAEIRKDGEGAADMVLRNEL